MVGNSRRVLSSQSGPHRRLESTVLRHLESTWRRPVARHSRAAFDAIARGIASDATIVLDSGCGTGESTRMLAASHPDAMVIGVDKSAHRLSRHGEYGPGYSLVRADLNDFWRLLLARRLPVSHHYLLYPNPWPKPGQLNRRWHASPAFPVILGLGGALELRTNWSIYAEEFAAALALVGFASDIECFTPDEPICPFERKYAASGQTLYRLVADMGVECASS